MDPLLISAASGMKARMESLDMLANNIANTGTIAYKADEEFYTLYKQQLPLIENRWTDFTQGSILPTGNQLDLALSGPGFFALNGTKGTVYTRNGSFRLSKTNQLVSADGYTLRNVLDQGKPIVVDPQQTVSIDKSGMVSQGGQQLGQLQIDQIPSAVDAIGKLGNSYFALNLTTLNPGSAPKTTAETDVMQGQLEQSNVPVADSTVRLLSLMRQFEMLQKALNVGSEMNKEAIQEVAKAS
jgi:flagellar basal body rod protein FlgG